MELQIAQTLFEAIDAALSSTLATGTAKVMAGVGGVFGTAWILTFMLSAMRWLHTGLTDQIEDVLWRILRMAIVVAFAFNVSWYLAKVVPVVIEIPVWVGGALSGSEAKVSNQVDQLINSFIDAVIKVIDMLDFSALDSFSVIAAGICIIVFLCLGGIPFLSLCVGTLIVLKASTALFLAVGPLFIAFALFEQTYRWFWNWVSIVAGFMLANVLFSVVIGLALNFIDTFVLKGGQMEPTWSGAFSVLFFFGAWTLLASQLPDYAATVMGGASSGSTGIKGAAGKLTGLSTASKLAGGAAGFIAKRLLRRRNRIQ